MMQCHKRTIFTIIKLLYIIIDDNLNLRVARVLEVLKHFSKDKDSKITNDKTYIDEEESIKAIRYLQNWLIVIVEPYT